MKIAVTTPAGNIGKHIVTKLLERGLPLVMVGLDRQREKLSGINAELRIANSDNEAELTQALDGITDLFWLTPPHNGPMRAWFQRTALAAAGAIRKAGVKRVVNLSSIGAGLGEGMGTLTYIGETEKTLNEAAPNIVHLRPGYFMENLLLQKPGKLELPFAPDHDIPWIAATDIAEAAVSYLADPEWRGKAWRHLMGPENITGQDLAARTGTSYRQTTLEEERTKLREVGLVTEAAEDLVDLFRALGDPNGAYAIPRTWEAFTPTKVEEFLEANRASSRSSS